MSGSVRGAKEQSFAPTRQLRQNRQRRSCSHHRLLFSEVGLVGRASVKARVRAPLVVKGQIPADGGARLGHAIVSAQIVE